MKRPLHRLSKMCPAPRPEVAGYPSPLNLDEPPTPDYPEKAMEEPLRKHLDHQTPYWVRNDATFFVTICTEPKGLNQLCHASVGADILKSIEHYHKTYKWFCHLALLMPDHVHFLLSFPDIPSFSPIIGDWKRWGALRHRICWQENFFEHRLRNEADRNKGDYILHNPVRAGFVDKFEDWPYKWMPSSV